MKIEHYAVSLLFVVLTIWATSARADYVQYIGGNGAWSDPANWDTGNVPVAGDEVLVTKGHAVQFDVDYSSGGLSGLQLDEGSTINQNDMTMSLAGSFETIGSSGLGTYNQTGGNNIAFSVTLGSGPTGTGTYQLSGGASLAADMFNVDPADGTGIVSGGKHSKLLALNGDKGVESMKIMVPSVAQGRFNFTEEET